MPRPSVRGKLVQAGLETLHAKGFNGCSIQDITEAAGVPKGSFFNHFKSKELLVLEVLGPYAESNRIDMLFDSSKPPLERLRDHFNFLANSYEQFDYERGCLLGNLGAEIATSHPPVRDALREMLKGWGSVVAGVLKEAQETGALAADRNVDEVANFLVNAWEGVVFRLKIVKTRAPVDEFMDVCFGLLLK